MSAPSDALADDETVRERLALRTGGSVALTDDRLLVAADDELTSVSLDDVAEVTVEDFDYFLAVLSAVLVGWGLYSTRRNAALGLGFAAFGAVSLYWTYRKRGKARIKVAGRPKPISVFPADPAAFYDALEPLLAEDAGDDSSEEETA
ncbi:hypothetical protein [Halorussus caseinilyticus]|uniref:Uncharacterized protein n=1 Tax=Halorussus caseinilyticus TaxID=3034025 RepID=A0ABD5WE51_9EURY|nr:hypothetical protein [Halorussus sp. DT72]